jgi:sulfite exporter TauE/SafE
MCGPLFLSLPYGSNNTALHATSRAVIYSLGRTLTYTVFGLIIGWIGYLFSMAKLQAPLSIGIGILVLTVTAVHLTGSKFVAKTSLISIKYGAFKDWLVSVFNRIGRNSLFVVGVVNGLLPCAFVYAGLGSALTTGDPINSALYMTFFGLGTIPAMIFVALAAKVFGHSFRNGIQKSLPVFAVLLGVILILRGLSLNIPFLSPDLNEIIFGDCSFD